MASTHLDAFPSFPELPPEIQDLIWDCAAEGPTCPAAHFAAREEIVFEESAMIEPPKPPRKFPTLPSIAVLIRATPPRDLATQPTQLSALLRTSRAARRAALRRRDAWGPARALQLYGADRNTRKAAFQRVHAIPRADTSCGRQPETVVDIPSLWIDADRDLVILNSSWQRVSSFPRRRRIRSWPVQRAILISPSDLEEKSFGTSASERITPKALQIRRLNLNQAFREPIAKSPFSQVPKRFQRGSREFFVFSWQEIEEWLVLSGALSSLAHSVMMARVSEDRPCQRISCGDGNCEHRPIRAWRFMS
ncbi:hypothetical protein CPLU01_03076 [Colletotrichum plurivorum]|uniref:2EXR domain-containing protein n=1 Tax=Colletotrichum plurivorum TaxID=2175906 RepID=A0A8H6NKY2_9PEZI|nr:hypothetical protein CPLU01_03076 [Colletotrichum plurivorum]